METEVFLWVKQNWPQLAYNVTLSGILIGVYLKVRHFVIRQEKMWKLLMKIREFCAKLDEKAGIALYKDDDSE